MQMLLLLYVTVANVQILCSRNPRKKTERGCGERVSAPHAVSEGRLSNSNIPILHLEISSGCESAGFQLGAPWPAGIIVASREC